MRPQTDSRPAVVRSPFQTVLPDLVGFWEKCRAAIIWNFDLNRLWRPGRIHFALMKVFLHKLVYILPLQKPDFHFGIFVLRDIGIISRSQISNQPGIGIQSHGPYRRANFPHAAAEEALPLSLLQPFQRDRVQALRINKALEAFKLQGLPVMGQILGQRQSTFRRLLLFR